MKTVLLYVAITFLASGFIARAQTPVASNATANTATTTSATTLPEPEWSGQVSAIVDGKLVALESQTPTVGGGRVAAWVYRGLSSPIRATASTEFVVRLEPSQNPSAVVTLDRVSPDAKKGDRKVVVAKTSLMGFGKTTMNNSGVEVKFVKYGAGSAKIVPASPLTAGEYAFRTASGVSYLFGIDEKK